MYFFTNLFCFHSQPFHKKLFTQTLSFRFLKILYEEETCAINNLLSVPVALKLGEEKSNGICSKNINVFEEIRHVFKHESRNIHLSNFGKIK